MELKLTASQAEELKKLMDAKIAEQVQLQVEEFKKSLTPTPAVETEPQEELVDVNELFKLKEENAQLKKSLNNVITEANDGDLNNTKPETVEAVDKAVKSFFY